MNLIISPFRSERSSLENWRKMKALRRIAIDMGFEPMTVVGRFGGVTEYSMIIKAEPEDIRGWFVIASYGFQQDCILVVYKNFDSCLVFSDHYQWLGKFTKINFSDLKVGQDYTQIGCETFVTVGTQHEC